ncbi:membrane protein insertase YidC [Corynebacterium epidermidicanis]|uniref:Membrane protein insertase YidC n=1 Tax=Corynebacterium epidermidicanis TaxID=1050174 RepID=A0A0G3GUL6_9CORY|nr:membrane protein insertase YidC [Corynebacterium epidermidicanis]AKK04195.1 membrane protein insertase, YidC/Oxa1 family, C-terminal domain [Corynebacterium epidermidicanis]
MIYPVSAVLKFWHWFLHSGLGLSTPTSWLLSIFGLIITVRSIVAPTSWLMMKSGRISQLLRPRMKEIELEYQQRTDGEASKWKREETKRVQKEAGYNMWAGCVPMLIQFPVFIGLYQVLLRMARPAEGFHAVHKPIGFLTSADIEDFISVRVANVPLPAYYSMSEQAMADLGTNRADVAGLVIPLLSAACLFTTINMIYSSYRGYKTLDWSSKFAVGVTRALLSFIPLVPIMLLSSALTAPVPAAIIIYWFGGNLWTMSQYIVLTYLLHRNHPLTPEFEAFREETKREFKEKARTKRAHKRFVRKKRLLTVLQPHRASTHRQELQEHRAERQAALEAQLALQAEAKARAKARNAAEREARRQRMAEKQSKKKNQME